MKKILCLLITALALVLSTCAQVPKESVELSATVGRDLAEMHRAHRELVMIFYDRILYDVNAFVDDVYTPYQIQKTLAEYQGVLSNAILEASRPDRSGEAQKHAFALLGVYLEELRNDIESYREQKLDPIVQQRGLLLSKIDDSYSRIHYANAIVTGHLSSVVKVHEAQNEILAKLELENLRARVGDEAVKLSVKLDELLNKARKGQEDVDELSDQLETLVKEFSDGKFK